MIGDMHVAVPPGLDINALAALCGQDAADLMVLCAQRPDAPHAASDLRHEAVAPWLPESVRSHLLGQATDGQQIWGYSWGTHGPRVLMYAWPHPDEPAGALAARWLLEHADHPALAHARWMVIPCADPAAASYSERWAEGRSMEDFVYGSLRPEHLQREVDYGFPIDGSLFVMPPWRDGARACWSAGRCVDPDGCGEKCKRLGGVPGPLPESLALARAVDKFGPDLAVGLHNATAGGAYNFWLHRPTADRLHLAAAVSEACGLPRHLGVKIDPGRAWRRAWPDARVEPTLEDTERIFRKRHGIPQDSAQRYLHPGSFAQYLSMRCPGAEYLVPEAGLWTHPDFQNQSPVQDTTRVRFHDGAVRSDRVRQVSGTLTLPWGEKRDVIYRRWRTQASLPEEQLHVPVSVGMLMIDAVELRRALFEAADELWATLPKSVREGDDLYAAERRSFNADGRYVRQSTARWARSERNTRTATRAEWADYRWRWALESCAAAGRCVAFAERSGYGHLAQPLRGKIDSVLAQLPLTEARCHVALSQLARVLCRIEEMQ
jgi:hypothetical protein